MASINKHHKTHEGGRAVFVTGEQLLNRVIFTGLLWEDQFYVDGLHVAYQVERAVHQIKSVRLIQIIQCARRAFGIRHVPLYVIDAMLTVPTHHQWIAQAIEEAVSRPDDLTELVAIYWRSGKKPLPAQYKKGIRRSLEQKFDAYQLRKYERHKTAIKLSDLIRLTHPRPQTSEQSEVFKELVNRQKQSADTWEVALSTQKEHGKEAFERLMRENKLGSLALIRNVRKMDKLHVDQDFLCQKITEANPNKLFPFQIITAAKENPRFEHCFDQLFQRWAVLQTPIPGDTCILVDHSGSMSYELSEKNVRTRFDAACGVAIIGNELFEHATVLSFSSDVATVPSRRGLALYDAIYHAQSFQGTHLGHALKTIDTNQFDRVIVITDEQSHDDVKPVNIPRRYIINVGAYERGVNYESYIHVNGFSGAVFDFIQAYESENSATFG